MCGVCVVGVCWWGLVDVGVDQVVCCCVGYCVDWVVCDQVVECVVCGCVDFGIVLCMCYCVCVEL